MPNYDYVFVATGLPPEKVASLIGERLHIEAGVSNDGVTYITRPGQSVGTVSATVESNDFGSPDEFEPDEVAAYAGYDTIMQVWTAPRNTDAQRAEARRLFDDIVGAFPVWPALLTHAFDVVMATWRDGSLHEFPDGLSAWTSQRAVWEPLVVPYQPPPDLNGP